MTIVVVAALCRLIRDGMTLLLWGSSVYLVAVAPPALRPLLEPFAVRLHRIAVPALAIAVAALLPVAAAGVGQGWGDAVDPSVLTAILVGTSIGTAWLVQATAAAGLLLLPLLPAFRRDRAAAVLVALLLGGLTLTGHTAMHDGSLGAVQRASGIVHLLAAGFWLGALAPLLPTLSALRDPTHQTAAATALRRFSTVGHGAVALVIVTGTVNTTLVLGGWPGDWASPYRRLLAIKVMLVGLMAALALLNRYVVVPRIRDAPYLALRRIRQATLAELGLGAAAIALVAIFGQLDPS